MFLRILIEVRRPLLLGRARGHGGEDQRLVKGVLLDEHLALHRHEPLLGLVAGDEGGVVVLEDVPDEGLVMVLVRLHRRRALGVEVPLELLLVEALVVAVRRGALGQAEEVAEGAIHRGDVVHDVHHLVPAGEAEPARHLLVRLREVLPEDEPYLHDADAAVAGVGQVPDLDARVEGLDEVVDVGPDVVLAEVQPVAEHEGDLAADRRSVVLGEQVVGEAPEAVARGVVPEARHHHAEVCVGGRREGRVAVAHREEHHLRDDRAEDGGPLEVGRRDQAEEHLEERGPPGVFEGREVEEGVDGPRAEEPQRLVDHRSDGGLAGHLVELDAEELQALDAAPDSTPGTGSRSRRERCEPGRLRRARGWSAPSRRGRRRAALPRRRTRTGTRTASAPARAGRRARGEPPSSRRAGDRCLSARSDARFHRRAMRAPSSRRGA